ncbi:kielin/chordin-like protein [Oscarella lobularis]|uniref:kielin/chordin-like protein n=1 Tax=Oscarella lobularis TaxID=121494 RepID=UPI0033137AA7
MRSISLFVLAIAVAACSAALPTSSSKCPPFQCHLSCKNGYVRDDNDCRKCQCLHVRPTGGPLSGRPHSGRPHSGRPHSGRPHSGRPHSGHPHLPTGQPLSGRPHSGRPHPHTGGPLSGRPHSGRPHPHTGRPHSGRPLSGAPEGTCSPRKCVQQCPNGYVYGPKGCQTCRCKPKPTATPSRLPSVTCSPVLCLIHCPFGFEKDANGCNRCKCRTKPTTAPTGIMMTPSSGCARKHCLRQCQHGYVMDANGCKTCQCKTKPTGRPTQGVTCAIPNCLRKCPNGYIVGPKGCQTCKCKPKPTTMPPQSSSPTKVTCAPVRCRIRCQYGYVKNAYGCEICQCKPKPTTMPPPQTSSPTKVTCAPVRCRIRCPYGYVKNAQGCEICQCKPKSTAMPPTSSSQPRCVLPCPLGLTCKIVNGKQQCVNPCATVRCPGVCSVVKGKAFCGCNFGGYQVKYGSVFRGNDTCTRCSCNRTSSLQCSVLNKLCRSTGFCNPNAPCTKMCKGGYVMKGNCALCQCKSKSTAMPPTSSSQPRCVLPCPLGLTCKIVSGKPQCVNPCSTVRCPGVCSVVKGKAFCGCNFGGYQVKYGSVFRGNDTCTRCFCNRTSSLKCSVLNKLCRSTGFCNPNAPCTELCKGGYVMKGNCALCQCRGGKPTSSPPPEPTGCPSIGCKNLCPGGRAVDAKGCPTCKCLPVPTGCPSIDCNNACPGGRVVNAKGCQTCQCLPGKCDASKLMACFASSGRPVSPCAVMRQAANCFKNAGPTSSLVGCTKAMNASISKRYSQLRMNLTKSCQSKKQCIYGGQSQMNGTQFPSRDGCNTCFCLNGDVSCTEKACVTPTSCVYDGKSYSVGDSFKALDGCNECSCSEDGETSCDMNPCSTTK